MIYLLIALAIAGAGDVILGKLWLSARSEVAAETQKYDSFVADVRVMGEKAQADAKARTMSDKLAKDTADAENAATVLRLNTAIAKLRIDADRARGSLVPPAPAGSKCPPGQACFDAAGLESALRSRRDRVRGLADEGTAVESDLATARQWAQSTR